LVIGRRKERTAHFMTMSTSHFRYTEALTVFWHYKCFAGCGEGDEIMFLRKLRGLSVNDAMNLYLSMAGFPSRAPRKSPECPQSRQSPWSPETRKCHESPKSPVFPMYPMSNGQELEQALRACAARNVYKQRGSEKKALWQLARELVAIQKRSGPEAE
jgi:hypothetical protein